MRSESVIDRLLIDAKQALDQMPLDRDAATLEALAEIRGRIEREVAALAAEARAGVSAGDLILRLEALRMEIDRRLAPHWIRGRPIRRPPRAADFSKGWSVTRVF